jgi:hypothetical protein
MALWGNNDNLLVQSGGTVALDYDTLIVTGTGTTFGTAGYANEGDIIHFGYRDATPGAGTTYFGAAVIVGVASTTQLTIGSTAGLTGGGIGGTTFTVNQAPKFTTWDSAFSQKTAVSGDGDVFVYGIGRTGSEAAVTTQYETGSGWVGITTYNDNEGNLRVKKEILVAMSGIATGNIPAFPDQK